jgi:DnaJ family protein C protein 19
MSKREAALILSIRESANKDEIRETHRRLMMLNHPDNGMYSLIIIKIKGGSNYLALKVNEAKEILILTAREDKL